MGVGGKILDAVKKVGMWAVKNPDAVMNAVNQVKDRAQLKKTEKDAPLVAAQLKIAQLGEAVVELDQKLEGEADQLRQELATLRKEMEETLQKQQALEAKQVILDAYRKAKQQRQ